MIVTVEKKARPCPGVERAIALAEDKLNHGNKLFTIGQLIHNEREVNRLECMGLQIITKDKLSDQSHRHSLHEANFLVRAHGEQEDIINLVKAKGMKIVDATCPIVHYSQDLVTQHVREGYGIIIAGNPNHPEVSGLLNRSPKNGAVVASLDDAKKMDFEDRSLLIAQTTIDPALFSEVRRILSGRLSNLKIIDTICHFLQNRIKDIASFAEKQNVIVLVGGQHSSNCKLLFNSALQTNERSYMVQGPDGIDKKWFKSDEKVGICGGASTPRWQLEEMRNYLNNHYFDKNPKGFKNRKGGKFLWWTQKNQN